MNLVFLDTETTGLDPNRHEVWEIAYAVGDGPIKSAIVPHKFTNPDPLALKMNGYLDRAVDAKVDQFFEADLLDELTGATIVGANPAFDTAFLRARWNEAPWHHRLWDIEAYAAGVLGWDSLKGMAGVSEALRERGWQIPRPDHSAAGDVAALRASFHALQKIAEGNA